MPDSDKWPEILNSIEPIKRAGLIQWQLMRIGSSNLVFKVTTHEGVWVVRINRAVLGIFRSEEQRILELVEELGVGPKIIANDPKAGYLITEYIKQPTWTLTDLNKKAQLQQLKTCLRKFHSIQYDYLPSRLDHRLKLYLKKIDTVPEKITIELLRTIQKLDFLKFWDANTTLYHSDLNLNNLLGKNKLKIIDWEYAGQGHPLLDWLILEHQTQIDLSAHYPNDINPAWLDPAKRMINAMMALWPTQSP